MNIAAPVIAEQPIGVSIVRDARGLESFRDPACAAAIWHREVPSQIMDWLEGLDADVLPNARVVLPVGMVKYAVEQHCDISGMPEGPDRDWLIDDVEALTQKFAALMGAEYVRLRLQAITTNACRKFHIDAITCRLLCTYRGSGTQYGTSSNGEDPDRIFDAPKGAAVMLRGSLWPTEPAAGLLHRSPPIEGTGETRLVLVLDPIFDPKNEE